MAATWKIKKKENRYAAYYSGDLHEALEKARRDLERYTNDEDIKKWIWLKEMAEAKIAANERAIERAQIFIDMAKRELKNKETENG